MDQYNTAYVADFEFLINLSYRIVYMLYIIGQWFFLDMVSSVRQEWLYSQYASKLTGKKSSYRGYL